MGWPDLEGEFAPDFSWSDVLRVKVDDAGLRFRNLRYRFSVVSFAGRYGNWSKVTGVKGKVSGTHSLTVTSWAIVRAIGSSFVKGLWKTCSNSTWLTS